MPDQDLWEIERRFWLDGADVCRRSMTGDAAMVLSPPAGVVKADSVLETIEAGPRWDDVDIEALHEAERAGTAVLVYKATGRRSASPTYVAYCSSVYVRDEGEWKMLSHQQTPIAGQ